MRRMLCFARRNRKELLRDPISLFFGILFPIILLLLLTVIDRSLPAEAQMDLFHAEKLAPGIAVFSLSFIALFAAMLISKDRGSSFLLRLYTSPLTGRDFILGYLLPLLPMAVVQMLACFAAAMALGLHFTFHIFLAIAVCLPIAAVNIAIGMLCGTLLSEKAVGGVCGALLTNLSAWLSGIWFSLDLIGGAFQKIAYLLPFANAVDAARAALTGNYGAIWTNLRIVLLWALILLLTAIAVFAKKMKLK